MIEWAWVQSAASITKSGPLIPRIVSMMSNWFSNTTFSLVNTVLRFDAYYAESWRRPTNSQFDSKQTLDAAWSCRWIERSSNERWMSSKRHRQRAQRARCLIDLFFCFPRLAAAEQLEYVEAGDSWFLAGIGCVQSVHSAIYEWKMRGYCKIIWRRMWIRRLTESIVIFCSILERIGPNRKWNECGRWRRIRSQANEIERVHCVFGHFPEWYHRCSDQGNHREHWSAYVWMRHHIHIHQCADFGADSRTRPLDCVAWKVSMFN